MKNMIIAALLASSLGSTAVADELTHEGCTGLSSLANTIMTARQTGVSMSKLMNADFVKGSDEEVREVYEFMIITAYEQTRWNSERGQQRAIRDFENDLHLGCVQQLRAEAN